jgi:hypothetical protein
MALISVALGPGAAAAFYAYYREGQILNLQETTVVAEEEDAEEDEEEEDEEEEEE